MIPLASNPAVIDPKATLTTAQSQALLAIRFYRFSKRERRGWRVGNHKATSGTIKALIGHELVKDRGGLNPLTLTTAGELASDKLRG
ncbi:hypothetical protein H4S14_000774 [Agrobacterium vitis]|nr:hypothetical protein [Agrobacterium vitis]MBE1437047.1 hypothetical protein [Agrobacterium vitis]